MEKRSKLPTTCPSCSSTLNVRTLQCSSCDTAVSGNFALPPLLLLTDDEQLFITDFVRFSGSIKDMSKHLKLSYPSVRNMLDAIIAKIESLNSQES